MENWFIPELEQKKYMMGMEYLLVPGTEEVLKYKLKDGGGISKGHRSHLKELPRPRLEPHEQKKDRIVLSPNKQDKYP